MSEPNPLDPWCADTSAADKAFIELAARIVEEAACIDNVPLNFIELTDAQYRRAMGKLLYLDGYRFVGGRWHGRPMGTSKLGPMLSPYEIPTYFSNHPDADGFYQRNIGLNDEHRESVVAEFKKISPPENGIAHSPAVKAQTMLRGMGYWDWVINGPARTENARKPPPKPEETPPDIRPSNGPGALAGGSGRLGGSGTCSYCNEWFSNVGFHHGECPVLNSNKQKK